MKLVSAEEMSTIDELASSHYHISSLVLMENAGRQVAEAVSETLGGKVIGRKILVIAGRGNNGGDGLVAARHLYNRGAEVTVVMIAARNTDVVGDARVNLEVLNHLPVKQLLFRDEKDLNVVRLALIASDVVVDALYGTGFRGAPPALVNRLIAQVNNSAKPVVAVDIPSGVEANSGKIRGEAIKATCTVTFALPKIGLVMEPGASNTGRLIVADISIPRVLINDQTILGSYLDQGWCMSRLVRRQPESHKGDYGHALILGASPGMTGAVCMAAEAALRTGAGLVTVGIPAALNAIIEMKLSEAMSRPLPQTTTGRIGPEAISALEDLLPQVSAAAIGPGLSQYPEAAELIGRLLERISVPLVLDADALNILAQTPDLIKQSKGALVLTPHPGEMARLLQTTVQEVQEDRLAAARKAAAAFQAVIVLKGARTLVVFPGGEWLVNSSGNPGMATAGTGDVLTGMITGFLAQRVSLGDAVGLAVWLHGAAGDRAAGASGFRGLTAGDIINNVPRELKELESMIGERLERGECWYAG